MPAPVCDMDCFHCRYPDCINDEAASYDERRELDALEKEIILPKSGKAAEIAAKQRAYREANREEIAAKQRAYREANREEIAAKQRAYYEANREEIAAKKKAYYEANREEIAAKNKAYYEANREKWRWYYQKRKKKEVV